MTKEKQIDEMARDIGWSRCTDCIAVNSCSECPVGIANECFFKEIAEYLCNKGYRKASDVAREIFAEIEELLKVHRISVHFNNYDAALTEAIAELKKKYTEEGK